MKQGDKVVCINTNWIVAPWLDNVKFPNSEDVYIVASVQDTQFGVGITLEGFNQSHRFVISFFRKVENRTNALSKELAEEFIREDIVKEQEIERVFSLNTPF